MTNTGCGLQFKKPFHEPGCSNMKPYSEDDIFALKDTALNGLYAYIQLKRFLPEVVSITESKAYDPKTMPGEILRFRFYDESFHINLSEMYSFFEKAKDTELLEQLKLSAEKRRVHRNIRHGISHFGKPGEPSRLDTLDMRLELAKIAGHNDEASDYFCMVRYLKKMGMVQYSPKDMPSDPTTYEAFKTFININLEEVIRVTGVVLEKKYLDELFG